MSQKRQHEDELRQRVENLQDRANRLLKNEGVSLHLALSLQDVYENDADSQGWLSRGYLEFAKEQDFLTLDLRVDDLDRQLVNELRRIGGIYRTVVSDLANGLDLLKGG